MNVFLYKYIKIVKYKFIFIFIFCSIDECIARPEVCLPSQGTLTIENLKKISDNNNVPLWAMIGILAVERGKNGQALQNPNGTWDLGAFQINTIHINNLEKLGISASSVMNNVNVNAVVAGYLLGQHYQREDNIWEAIGSYHSKTPSIKNRYIKAVQKNLLELVEQKNVDLLLSYVNGH